ncbi:hypothetical protein MNBD_PLANCTO02-29 [hydrothermal vent metagenome]|uniref:Methyltransferase type 11 domain-containing protein n=1 Tax=hydrothermal vent metagenome TaxID=652676 RepID=A0A3B1DWN7_9ZZZZ
MESTEIQSLEILDCLRCPQHQEISLQQHSGETLICPQCNTTYPVQGGIPRFVQSEHLASFGLQWNKYEVAHDDEDRATFQAKTGTTLDELSKLRILDAGCGGGRYCKVAGEAGATVIGADHSDAVEKATQLCAHLPNVDFLQGDLKHLPLEPESFDFAFSIGVMHHDSNTKAVFDAVAKMVKPGGRYSVWLYRKNQWWQELINTGLRNKTIHWSTKRLERLSRIGAFLGGLPFVKQTFNKIVNFSNHPHWENRVCDTFDWYAPQYQYHHTTEELCEWFTEAGFEKLEILPPEKTGALYRWTYNRSLLIGSGVNVTGRKKI